MNNRIVRAVSAPLLPAVARRMLTKNLGRDLLEHCAAEMNHLATRLPALHDEFRDLP